MRIMSNRAQERRTEYLSSGNQLHHSPIGHRSVAILALLSSRGSFAVNAASAEVAPGAVVVCACLADGENRLDLFDAPTRASGGTPSVPPDARVFYLFTPVYSSKEL